jgi:hypothetical protein
LQALFGSVALDAASWAAVLLLGGLSFMAVELEKAWLRRRGVLRF